MFASSDSAASTVKVLPEDSIVAAQAWFMPDEGGNWTPVTGTVHYGATLGLWVETRGVSGIGFPTGKVEVTLDQTPGRDHFPSTKWDRRWSKWISYLRPPVSFPGITPSL